jgi:hypothetical protein
MGKAHKIVEGIEQSEHEDENIQFDSETGLIQPVPEPTRENDTKQVSKKPTSQALRLPTNIYD